MSYVKVAVEGEGNRRLQAVSMSERTEEGTTVVALAGAKPSVAADYSEALMCHVLNIPPLCLERLFNSCLVLQKKRGRLRREPVTSTLPF